MIRYLKHDEIDKFKWDQCIDHAVNGIIYARSWYLDIVSPDWQALVEDDYVSVFPLTQRRKYFIHYLCQPFFAQQLGVFTKNQLTESLVDNFLEAIPSRFRFAQINLNYLNKADTARYPCQKRINIELNLKESYENIQKKFDKNTRRNIKKAMNAGLMIRKGVEPDELITLFRNNYGKKENILKGKDYETLRKLLNYSIKHKHGFTLGVCLPDGALAAAVFFLNDKTRWIFHFAASDKKARETGAMFLLVDGFIREQSGSLQILDFEGSNDPNVARFYKGFGAGEGNYYQVTLNRLPGIAKSILYFKNRFQGR